MGPGARLRRPGDAYRLVEKRRGLGNRWALDVASLERAVTPKTRVIMVTNPNNPTGAVLTEEEMDEIIRVARSAGAWIVADEVYRGAEVASETTSPTFWGRYTKVIVTAGLSKAFGLPGLRIGWIVAPPTAGRALLVVPGLHDADAHDAVGPPGAGRHGAPAPRGDPARTRAIIRRHLPVVEEWIRGHGELLEYIPPVAGAIALVKYRLPIGSAALFDRLRLEKSVLITPGRPFRDREVHSDRLRVRRRARL